MYPYLEKFFFYISLFLYLFSTCTYHIGYRQKEKKFYRFSIYILFFAFLSHSLSIFQRYLGSGRIPLVDLHESLSFFSWSIIVVFFFVYLKYRIEVLGVFVLPLVSIFMLASFLTMRSPGPMPPALKSHLLPIHATFSFLGDGLFAVAFCVSLMYLIQERQIKKKEIKKSYFRLPSLKLLDDLNYATLALGFIFLTVGIVTGSIWAQKAWGSYWSWDPKETWSLITWFVYAALLHGRLNMGWRGKKAAFFSIVGFFCILFTFLGVNLILPGLHRYS